MQVLFIKMTNKVKYNLRYNNSITDSAVVFFAISS